jgi:tetratricopeptide (TPR) repeat protein
MRPLSWLALSLALSLSTTACGTGGGNGAKPPVSPHGPVNVVSIDDAQFAPSAYQVLLTGEQTPDRAGLLAGVVRRQMARAAQRFDSGQKTAGLSALAGALYLLRVGELTPEMLSGSAPALRAGAAEVARTGNEGRAEALYSMLRTVLPAGKERDDVEAHLKALTRWSSASSVAGPMQAAGSLQRSATDRALFDPTPQALSAAKDANVAWIKRALEFSANDGARPGGFDREEAVEAYRAVRAGGATLVALYLRYSDAKGALAALDQGDLLRVVPPGLVERLERAADDDDPGAWAELYRLYSEADEADRPETSIDAELGRAAAWGAAVDLFRAEPRSLRGSGPLAVQLMDYGMAEVAPLVLGPALGDRPSAQDLSWSLALVLRAVLSEDEIGEHQAARRTFQGAKPILDLARQSQLVGKIRPTPARLEYVMGALETRAGDLGAARPHIEAAVKDEPSIDAWSLLAAIDRQRGDATNALSSLDRVIALAKKQGDYSSETEALLTQFEIQRDAGQAAQAKTALDQALSRALEARHVSRSSGDQARAERLLARVLERFGAREDAKRATERAYEASRADSRQLTATVLDASRRAFVSGDLPAARDALRQAVDARLDDEDLVYVALWTKLLEQRLGSPTDGAADEALGTIDEDSGWPAKLSAWARGKLTDTQLEKSARTRVQQTEAKFYTAVAKQGKAGDGKQALSEVAKSEAIELVEVAMARDLVAREMPLKMELPSGVRVP